MELFIQCICFLLAGVLAIYLLLLKRFSYWADRGVVHEKPVLFYGNMKGVGSKYPIFQPFRGFYAKFKGQAPFAGFYLFMRPAALLLDLELIKAVLIKDFNNFSFRGTYYNERDDPLSAHLLNLDGPKWRQLRTKLTPTFTSGKMKCMLPSLVEVGEKLIKVIGEQVVALQQQKQPSEALGIEMKELLARFTTDVIGSCAFGLQCNSLDDPNTQFVRMSQRALFHRRHKKLVFAFMQAFPNVARKLRMCLVDQQVSDFFMGVVRQTVEYREREHIKRNDFMNILLELKQNNEMEAGLTLEQIAAQAFVFFLAGYETSSSTMGFCLYELALHPEIQQRARDEINASLERHKGIFTYECLRELKYLLQIMRETLRIYSIATLVMRKTLEDYPVPNSKHIIEKDTIVIIPIDSIHHDSDIYPDPELFDPERFTPAAIEARSSVAWLAFGEGPRNCIGMRFGEMQTLVGLAMLLKNFIFSPGPRTQIPLVFDEKHFLMAAKGGIYLNVAKI